MSVKENMSVATGGRRGHGEGSAPRRRAAPCRAGSRWLDAVRGAEQQHQEEVKAVLWSGELNPLDSHHNTVVTEFGARRQVTGHHSAN